MGKYNRMGWAWFGATLGGYLGEGIVGLLLSGVPAEAGGFLVGAFLGVLAGETLTSFSVAKGIKGMVLGTKHGLSASAGGYVGLLVSRNVPMEAVTALPELTVAAIGALVSVILFEILL
ncbi:MAG: hypothetical protein V5A62_19240 [Haloarculaceae archaeon]